MAGEFLSFLGRGVSKFGQDLTDANEQQARLEQQQAEMAALQEERLFNRKWKLDQDAQEAEAIKREQVKELLNTLAGQQDNFIDDPNMIADVQKYAPGRIRPDTLGSAVAGGLAKPRFRVLRDPNSQKYVDSQADETELKKIMGGVTDWSNPTSLIGAFGKASGVDPSYGTHAASLAREVYGQNQANAREAAGNATQLEASRINAASRPEPRSYLDPNQENEQFMWRQSFQARQRQEQAIPGIAMKTLNENPRMAMKSGTPEYMTALQALIAQMQQSLPPMPTQPKF